MAIDKAVDSAVLEAGLTIIANAIREKGGTSDTLAFPDAMAEAIAAIEAGGGAAKFATGTFTPAEDSAVNTEYEIEHNSGFVPDVFIMTESTAAAYKLRLAISFPVSFWDNLQSGINRSEYSSYIISHNAYTTGYSFGAAATMGTTTDKVVYIKTSNTKSKIIAGYEYTWFAVGGLE